MDIKHCMCTIFFVRKYLLRIQNNVLGGNHYVDCYGDYFHFVLVWYEITMLQT